MKNVILIGLISLILFSGCVSNTEQSSTGLLPLKQCRTVQEPYTEIETYTEMEPYQETQTTQWDVTWSTLTGDLKWGASVGTATFPATFDYDWKIGPVFQNYDDYIGFTATAKVYMPRNGPVKFEAGSDDGIKLYVDGAEVISNWRTWAYRKNDSTINLNKGYHNLRLVYYEAYGAARVSFNADSDIFSWEETKYREVQKQRTITKFRTVEKCD